MAPKNDFMTRKMTKAKWKSRPIQSQIKDYHPNAKIAVFCALFLNICPIRSPQIVIRRSNRATYKSMQLALRPILMKYALHCVTYNI